MSTALVRRVGSAILLSGLSAAGMSMFAQTAPPPPAPVFSAPAGTYPQPETLTMTAAGTAAIYYTSDGSTPNLVSPQYSGPITIGVGTATVQAIAVDTNGQQSAVTSATYVVTTPQSTTSLIANPLSLVLPGTLQLSSTVNPTASGGAVPTGTVTFYSDTTNELGTVKLKLDPTTQAWTQHISEGTPLVNPAGLATVTLSPGTQPVMVSAQSAFSSGFASFAATGPRPADIVASGEPNVALYKTSPSGSTPMSVYTYTDPYLSQIDAVASGYFLQPKSTGVQSFVVHPSFQYLVFDGSTTSSENGNFLNQYSISSYSGCDCGWDGETLAVDDFDNDGYSDLGVYISSYNNGEYTQYPYAGVAINEGIGSGAGYFNNFIQAPSPFTGNTLFCPIGIATGHFTADAGAELAVLASSSATSCPDFTTPVAVYLFALDSAKTSLTLIGTPLTLPDLNATSITGADLNGDGITDLVIGESIPGASETVSGGIRTALGNGDGSFANASGVISTTSPPIGFTVNDFNGDGHADVAFTFYNGYRVLMGNGAGKLAGGNTYTYNPAINDLPGGIVSADLNGDGLADIATLEGTTFTNNSNLDIDLNSASAKASLTLGGQALTAGTHPLTATYAGDANFASSTSNIVNEVVTQTTPTVTWTGSGTTLEYGTPLSGAQLNATANVPGAFSYSPGLNAVLPPGSNTVTATFIPTDAFNYATVVSTLAIVVNSPTLSSISPASVREGSPATTLAVTGLGFVPGAVVSYNGGALATTYVDQHHVTAVIPANLLVNPATGTITATDPGGIAVVGSQAFAILAKITPTVTWTGSGTPLEYGTPLSSAQLNATASVPGAFSYSPGLNAVLPPGSNTVTATFTPTDTLNYATVVSTLPIVVNSPTLSSISPASVRVGSAATTLAVTGLGFVSGAVVSYNGGALVTTYVDQHHLTAVIPARLLVNPATSTITATDPGGIAVVGAQAFAILAKITPTVTWTGSGTPLEYGTPLSSAQLNATASVPGAFSYSPGLNAVLPPGNNTVTATFTPTDAFNYATVVSTLRIVVNSPTLSSISPASVRVGSAATTLAVTGLGFVSGAVVSYNGGALATTYVDQHHLRAVIPASLLVNLATGTITVTDPGGIAVVGSQPFTIIAKITPTVTWTGSGTPLEYGTPLSSVQLNATASVPGAFSYSPGLNAVLPPGNNTVTATFTPTDTLNYSTVVSTLAIVVNSPTLSSISPASVDVGAPATTLAVTGLGFVSGAVVSYNGGALATTYVDQHHLTAVLPAKLLVNPDSGTITATDPGGIAVVGSKPFTIIATPLTAKVSAEETSVTTGSQSTVTLTVDPYPVPVTATATLTFEPLAPITAQDPNVLFANGSTTDTETIATGTAASSIPFQFQAGSTAGTITVTIHLTLANGQDVTPTDLAPVAVTIPASPPVLSSPTLTRSGQTLQISVIALSSTRDMVEARFIFTPADGKSIKTTNITVPLSSKFQTWYESADSSPFGTNFMYTQPFTLDGDASDVSNVTIILVNSAGLSIPATVH